MHLEYSILKILDSFGITYKTNKRSIIFKDCPSCGKTKYSVWMFRPDMPDSNRCGGQCWVCGEKYSIYTYMKLLGHDPGEVRKALKIGKFSADLKPETWYLPDFEFSAEHAIKPEIEERDVEIPEHFMKIWDWPSHPVAKYARKRGILGSLGKNIYIDPFGMAVAFPVTCRDKLVGFQRRFINPGNGMKVKTDAGIPKARSFIKIGNPKGMICVVEGPFDAVAAAWCGFQGVCTMGAQVSRTQAQEIAMMANEEGRENNKVMLALDKDDAGEIGARELARLLDCYGIKFKKLEAAKDFKDLSEALENHGIDMNSVEEYLEIRGLVKINYGWSWSTQFLDGIKLKIGSTYNWKDFKEDTTDFGMKRENRLRQLAEHNPKKYEYVSDQIARRDGIRIRRLKLEGIMDVAKKEDADE